MRLIGDCRLKRVLNNDVERKVKEFLGYLNWVNIFD